MSHGTGNLFLAHEPLSDTHEYWPKREKEVRGKRRGLECLNCVVIEEFMLSALLHLISWSFLQFLSFPRVFSCSDSMESES